MQFNSKVYDILKFIAQIGLPALGTLYFALAAIWGIPAPEKVIGTIMSLDAFLGVCLGISSSGFNKQIATGTMSVAENEKGRMYTLELDGDPEYELPGKKRIHLDVAKHPSVTP